MRKRRKSDEVQGEEKESRVAWRDTHVYDEGDLSTKTESTAMLPLFEREERCGHIEIAAGEGVWR